MTLDKLKTGECGRIISVRGEGELRHHLLDMGLTPGTEVSLRKTAPMGDPVQLVLRGYELTLRLAEAAKIEIVSIESMTETKKENERHQPIAHPGVGELGKARDYRKNRIGDTIPKGEPITFALAGNQNCGKTTLFNQLTGSNQHVGNFPGVTVDKKEGSIRRHPEATVTDLPGIYSLSPYSSEEIVTRDFLLNEKPTGIINIVDASNIERNLYLTMQLMELGIPMVLALNMMDEVRANGGSVRINELEEILGIPVVPISAAKNEGIDELIDHAVHVARYREAPGRIDFCTDNQSPKDPVGALHRCIHAAVHLIEPYAKKAGLPVRFTATKIVEKDSLIEKRLALPEGEKKVLDGLVHVMEKDGGLDREAALANMRFNFIEKLCEKTVVKPAESREHKRSVAIDRILTGKYTAIPCFVGIMAIVFVMTFNYLGAWLSDGMTMVVNWVIALIGRGLEVAGVSSVLQSLVVDGILSGIGSVIGFLPTIVTLFFFLSILEDTGYMARVAFVMDKLLRKIGLSGRSIVPMLVGFGCTVPGVMASRTLPSERDRKMTILLTPFMSCSAKLPIYAFFTAAFFPDHGAIVMIALYFGGIIMGILMALLMRKTLFSGEAVPFVMELPNYRMPGAKNVGHLLWDKAKDFLQRAFTVIFMATLVIWFLQTFNTHLSIVTDSKDSILAMVASVIAPIFKPMGYGDWRISTALITGFMAKESVVSTLSILFGNTAALLGSITSLSAASLLAFCLLYTPCVAAIASIKRELGGKWAIFVVLAQCVIAWLVSFAVYLVGGLFF